jgi:hypothetical protein
VLLCSVGAEGAVGVMPSSASSWARSGLGAAPGVRRFPGRCRSPPGRGEPGGVEVLFGAAEPAPEMRSLSPGQGGGRRVETGHSCARSRRSWTRSRSGFTRHVESLDALTERAWAAARCFWARPLSLATFSARASRRRSLHLSHLEVAGELGDHAWAAVTSRSAA